MNNLIWTGLCLVILAILLPFVLPVGGILIGLLHTVGVIMIIVGIVMMLMGRKR